MLLSIAGWIFSRESLVRCQPISASVILNSQVRRLVSRLGLRRRGHRSGNHVKQPATTPATPRKIPVVMGNRMSTTARALALAVSDRQPPTRVSIPIVRSQPIDTTTPSGGRSADQYQPTLSAPPVECCGAVKAACRRTTFGRFVKQ